MSETALPPHLRGKLHGDWLWPFNKISRGWNAAGPRPGPFGPDYLPWPPRLVRGRGVSRWEDPGARSILHIPALDNIEINGDSVYNRSWLATEMAEGHPDFMKAKDVFFPPWEPANVYDMKVNGHYVQYCEPGHYSPSALQKFSQKGWMKLEPHYHAKWKVLKKRELPLWPETGEDAVMFYRRGNRPDHVDLYYNTDKMVPIGYVGLHWE